VYEKIKNEYGEFHQDIREIFGEEFEFCLGTKITKEEFIKEANRAFKAAERNEQKRLRGLSDSL